MERRQTAERRKRPARSRRQPASSGVRDLVRRSIIEVLSRGVSALSGTGLDVTERNPLPEAFSETATLPGFGTIRFWGDIASPAFEQELIDKDLQVLASAGADPTPRRLRQADFLAISGGGDKGAFAAGVLNGWSERGTRPEFEAVGGVSAGALAAPFAFLGSDYDHCLRDIYLENGALQLYKSRGLRGFLGDALNDTTRLEQLIKRQLTPEFLDLIAAQHYRGRRLFVMTTNLDAQRQVIWSLSGIAASDHPEKRELFAKVLRASSAIPGLFPPVKIDVLAEDGNIYDELHVDGGVTSELVFVPPETQALRAEDKVFARRRARCLYVIENGKLAPEYHASEIKVLSLALRAVSTMVKYQVIDNLLALHVIAKANNEDFRFNAIPGSFSEVPKKAFDRDFAKQLYAVGRELGLSGRWSATPPASPKLGLRELLEEERIEISEARDADLGQGVQS